MYCAFIPSIVQVGLKCRLNFRLYMVQKTASLGIIPLVLPTKYKYYSLETTLASCRKAHHIQTLINYIQAQYSFSPPYQTDLLEQYHPPQTLRSSNQSLLWVPKANTIFYGGRSFAVDGPNLWNNLPKFKQQAPTSATFKSLLKRTSLAL